MILSKGPTAVWMLGHCAYKGDDCLIWPFSLSRGYGQVPLAHSQVAKAHRVMCQLAHGAPPTPKHEAAHLCGNRACVNPKHLAWKTRSENQLDSVEMGRCYRDGKRGRLSMENARKILALKGTLSQDKIALQFGVTHSTVAKIHRGEIRKSKP